LLGIDARWGLAGLTASAGMSAWVEFTLLRRALNRRVGWTGLDRKFLAQLWGMAILAAAIAFAIKFATPHTGPRLEALMVIPAFGAIYLGLAYALDLEEFRGFVGIVKRRFGVRASA
jgi:putative peptidoglycan lipid II flippase